MQSFYQQIMKACQNNKMPKNVAYNFGQKNEFNSISEDFEIYPGTKTW